MLLSKLLSDFDANHIVRIENERSFDRFARTTSVIDEDSCVYVASSQYIRTIPDNATMVITTEEIANTLDKKSFGICISTDPKATYFRGVTAFANCKSVNTFKTKIGINCSISEMAFISTQNVIIGNNVIIEPFATINENVVIGNNCIIRSGARIGVEDYNYFRDGDDLIHLTHQGSLVLCDNVEIGYNTVVGKALYFGDRTFIGESCKIANECGIGHDVYFEDHVMVYAGSMIGGFVSIGSNSHIKLNCTVRNGISIGKNVVANMSSNIIRNIKDGETVFGNPAKRLLTPVIK